MTTKCTLYGADLFIGWTDASKQNWEAQIRVCELSREHTGAMVSYGSMSADTLRFRIAGTLDNLKRSAENRGFYGFGDWGLDSRFLQSIPLRDAERSVQLGKRIAGRVAKIEEIYGHPRTAETMLLHVLQAIRPAAVRQHSQANQTRDFGAAWHVTAKPERAADLLRDEFRRFINELREVHPEPFERKEIPAS